MGLIELSLFSGAGGGLLGSKLLGWKTVGYVEWNDYCQRIIAQRIKDGILDNAPIFGDIRTFNSEGYAARYKGMVDIVTGGFPCQDISCANTKGKGLDGEKSGLWFEMARTIRTIRPKFALVENSPILTVRGLDRLLGELAEMGYNARWCVLGGASIGRYGLLRERIWILAIDNEVNGERLQIQGRSNVKSKFRSNAAPSNLSDVSAEWFMANGYAVREVNDLARTMDRITAIGNGQISAVVRAAWEILSEGLI